MATKKEEKKEVKKNECIHEVDVEIKGEKWKNQLQKSFKEKSKKVNIPGFRKGHVPYDIFVRNQGEATLYFDACEKLVDTAYNQALEDSKLIPVMTSDYSIKDVNSDGVIFTFKIVTMPKAKIKKYKGLNVKKEKAKVTKEEVNDEIDRILEKYTELVIKDGKVANKDIAIIDYKGMKDGVAFDGGTGENYSLEIGSNTFIPGFEEQLIGMKKKETKTIDVTFPEDYHEESLKGAPVKFEVTVNEIKTREKRELDEELFEDLGIDGVNSKETLEEYVKNNLKEHKEFHIEEEYQANLLSKIAENTEVDIPDELVDFRVHEQIHRMEHELSHQGISLDLYLQFQQKTREDLHNELEPRMFEQIEYGAIIQELLKEEDPKVTKKEVDDKVKEIAEKYKMSQEDVIKEYGSLESLEEDLKVRKLFEKLEEYNKA